MNHTKNPISLLFLLLLTIICCDHKEESPKPDIPPSLTIGQIANEGAGTITVKVSVSFFGSKPVTEYGIVYGETATPTVDNNKVPFVGDKTLSYTISVANLKLNTTYYFRAYVLREDNTVTYSTENSLKTLLHQLTSFTPAAASPDMEVTINGNNFVPSITTLYLNESKVEAQVASSSIKFIVPFGLQTDSMSIAVEMGGIKLAFPKKLYYKRGRWTQVRSLSETQHMGGYSVSMSISDKGYVKTLAYKTIREYSSTTDSWTDITNFPFVTGQVNWFSVNKQIFSQTYDGGLLMYNVDGNVWNKILSPFPISNWDPFGGIAFSINDAGYMGLGRTNQLWKFNPSVSLNWTRVADFPGNGIFEAHAISMNEFVYVIGGHDAGPPASTQYYPETWRYSPTTDSWEKKSPYPGKGRVRMFGFVINNKLYMGCGSTKNSNNGIDVDGADINRDFWEYDPSTDTWKSVADFPNSRYWGYAFSLSGKGYSGGGLKQNGSTTFDLWKFEIQ